MKIINSIFLMVFVLQFAGLIEAARRGRSSVRPAAPRAAVRAAPVSARPIASRAALAPKSNLLATAKSLMPSMKAPVVSSLLSRAGELAGPAAVGLTAAVGGALTQRALGAINPAMMGMGAQGIPMMPPTQYPPQEYAAPLDNGLAPPYQYQQGMAPEPVMGFPMQGNVAPYAGAAY